MVKRDIVDNSEPGTALKSSFRTISPTSLVDQVRSEVRRAVTNGVLRPGDVFSITKLAADLGVSHIPVREALRGLESEGLIVLRPARSAMVRPLDVTDVKGIYRLRKLIEPHLASESISKLTEADFDRLDYLLTVIGDPEATTDEEMSAHEEFHLTLVGPAASQWDHRVLEFLWNANRRYARLFFDPSDATTRHRLGNLHHGLADVARSRSGDEIGAAVLRHLESNEIGLVEMIAAEERMGKSPPA